jgi:hypothetical protein
VVITQHFFFPIQFFLFFLCRAASAKSAALAPPENMPDEKNDLPSELPFNLDPKKLAKVYVDISSVYAGALNNNAERIRVLAHQNDTMQGEL